jgi:hypothetical protein
MTQYLYIIDALDIYSKDGDPMPAIQGNQLVFYDTPQAAYGKLFRKGFYDLVSEQDLFSDNKVPYVEEIFAVRGQLGALLTESPYTTGFFAQYPLDEIMFERLRIQRHALPEFKRLGGAKKAKGSISQRRTRNRTRGRRRAAPYSTK